MRKKYKINDILEQGEELFRSQGYNNTGIEDILKVSGIPKGSFYNFFKSKEKFGVKALEHYGEKQYRFAQQILTNPNFSPMERLKKLYHTTIDHYVTEDVKKGCLIGNLTLEMGGLSEDIRATADRILKMIVGLLETCIKEGQEKNEVRDDYSPCELANYLHNSFYGALIRGKSKGNKEPFDLFLKMTFNFIEKT